MSTVSDSKSGQVRSGTARSGRTKAARGRPVGTRTRVAVIARLVRKRLTGWLARQLTSFHLIVGLLALLTGLGLVMVLSASSVEAYAQDGSAYSVFVKQLVFAVVGLLLFYLALRIPVRTWRRLALPVLGVCVLLLAAVLIPGVGNEVNGARAWFVIGPVSLQPSEPTKIAFAVWGAHLLSLKRGQLHSLWHMLIPLIPAAVLVLALIVLEPDLGTTVTLGIVVLGLLWFAGAPVKLFLAVVFTAGGGVLILAMTASYRAARITSFLNPSADPQGGGYQAMQASYSLANGGLWGVGLGQSTGKWSYLPEAHNDFIFAILGEELGFVGCAVVLGLFGTLAYTGLRIASRSADPFLRLLAATVTVWLVGQAIINIGYVIGVLPVTGVTLPLVSSGGTSTAVTMFVFGLLANAARHEPQAVAALRSGGEGRFARLFPKVLRLPAPEPYVARPRARVVASTGAQPVRRATEQRRATSRGQVRQPARAPRTRSTEPVRRRVTGSTRGAEQGRGGRR
ncbi:MAG: putative lipid II flippase FtsW [Mycobacteriaceae bacterium]